MSLPLFELPLQSGAPPTGFGWEGRSESNLSSTTAFDRELDQRDSFFGVPSCVVCGLKRIVRHCHIIPKAESRTWTDLKRRGWIPQAAKASPVHEPRNGLVMCPNHRSSFDRYGFYIRFCPEKFIFINHSNDDDLQPSHGKAIALDITDRCAPFASLFIIHEWRVRGFQPFQPVIPSLPAEIMWQDWILSSGVFDSESGFKRSIPPPDNGNELPELPPAQPTSTSVGGRSTVMRALDNDVISEILAATRAQPSWKACELENTSWNGTAEENKKKYLDIMNR